MLNCSDTFVAEQTMATIQRIVSYAHSKKKYTWPFALVIKIINGNNTEDTTYS